MNGASEELHLNREFLTGIEERADNQMAFRLDYHSWTTVACTHSFPPCIAE